MSKPRTRTPGEQTGTFTGEISLPRHAQALPVFGSNAKLSFAITNRD